MTLMTSEVIAQAARCNLVTRRAPDRLPPRLVYEVPPRNLAQAHDIPGGERVVGSQLIYVFGVDLPSRHSADIKRARIDIDQREICRGSRGEPGIVGDARTVPRKRCERHPRDALKTAHGDWHRQLSALDTAHPRAQEAEQVPIHPPRLCQELRGIMDRDAIMAADGLETMDYAWRIITSVVPRHRPDPGSFGTKGVRPLFAPRAAAARPERASDRPGRRRLVQPECAGARFSYPAQADGARLHQPERSAARPEPGHTDHGKPAEPIGCHIELVKRPDEIARRSRARRRPFAAD